ncbi:MAG: polysaccharide biosynthesis tyrosine autokinase, partial [Muribaculaceae bacterium]|nr:polysaccharide biosynthesis tyrosine autokinase [Muribaculaceae bacterium]
PGGLEAYNALLLPRQDLLTSARADNTALKLLDEKIKTLRDNIKASFAKTLDNVNLRIRDVQNNIAQATAKLGTAPLNEREFLNLKRQQELKQSLYLFLLQRKEEVSMALANSFPKGTVVDSAFTLSEPLGMSNKLVFILAILFSFMLPPIALFLRRLISNVIESRSDVEKVTDIPLLGEMCEDKSGNKIVAVNGNKTSAAELFRMLRSSLLFVLNNSTDKIVLLTSSVPGEGKSFISLNMAASLAALGKKVIIVGMDIRKPTLAQYIGISPKYGVTQYLSSQSLSISQIVEKVPGVDNLDTIVAGPVPPNPAELLASEKVDELFAELRDMYDYIIVDTAPLGLVSDTFTLDRIADATICVCRLNRTKTTAFKELNDIYEHNRLKKLSIIINGSKSRKEYGYGN